MDRTYHAELESIRANVLLMGEKAIANFDRAIRVLCERDPIGADQVIEADKEIDAFEDKLNHDTIRYMAMRAPVASDMRLVAASLKIAHELERIGDESKSIAKRVRRVIAHSTNGIELLSIPPMAKAAHSMLEDSLEAFATQDRDATISIIRRDKQVDSFHRSNFDGFTAMIPQNPDLTAVLLELIFVSKSIERVADHAANVSEETIYYLSGVEVRHARIKDGGEVDLD